MTAVYISENAFWSLTLAAIEVYKKECFGYLVGNRTQDHWTVDKAVPNQTARRCYSWVTPGAPGRRRLQNALDAFGVGVRGIGWFHSHPEYGGKRFAAVLSKGDIGFTQIGEIVIVLEVHGTTRRKPWRQHGDGTLGRFSITIAGFEKTGDGQIEQLQAVCNYAHGFQAGRTPGPAPAALPLKGQPPVQERAMARRRTQRKAAKP